MSRLTPPRDEDDWRPVTRVQKENRERLEAIIAQGKPAIVVPPGQGAGMLHGAGRENFTISPKTKMRNAFPEKKEAEGKPMRSVVEIAEDELEEVLQRPGYALHEEQPPALNGASAAGKPRQTRIYQFDDATIRQWHQKYMQPGGTLGKTAKTHGVNPTSLRIRFQELGLKIKDQSQVILGVQNKEAVPSTNGDKSQYTEAAPQALALPPNLTAFLNEAQQLGGLVSFSGEINLTIKINF